MGLAGHERELNSPGRTYAKEIPQALLIAEWLGHSDGGVLAHKGKPWRGTIPKGGAALIRGRRGEILFEECHDLLIDFAPAWVDGLAGIEVETVGAALDDDQLVRDAGFLEGRRSARSIAPGGSSCRSRRGRSAWAACRS